MEPAGLDLAAIDYSILFTVLLAPILRRVAQLLTIAGGGALAFLAYTFLKYKINPFRLNIEKLRRQRVRFKPYSFLRWVIVDKADAATREKTFSEFGFTIFCGRQGAGKTVSMVEYLIRMKRKYPKCIIVTNFAFEHADKQMTGWRDFFEIRNETDGVIFAIDEIHSEYSSANWKDFPESLLSEISQQRKQRIKIVATSQQYSRVAKPIREQCFSVVQCITYLGRWTFCKEYDALDYDLYLGDNANRKKGRHKWFRKWSFVQSPGLRDSYDTYEKIERLEKVQFLERDTRA